MAAFAEFHLANRWCRSLSATFFTLIPKKKRATELKDFRPISLVGCIYKLLAKTLVTRFKISLGGNICES